MQFSAVLNIFTMKTKLNSFFTNYLKRKEIFSQNVHSYKPSFLNIEHKQIQNKKLLTDDENYYGTQYIKMFFFFLYLLVLISNS